MTKKDIIITIRTMCIILAIIGALTPLEDGNLVVRGGLILIPLIAMIIICWIVNKLWKNK